MFEIVARINTVEGIITPCVREDFSRYRKFVSTCECEICHQNRKRDSLVVIREEDGSEKVAGLDCLRKLYGKETVSKASKFADESEANMKMFDVNVEYFVNVAEDIQRLRGFTSKAEAKESAGRLVANADLLETWEPFLFRPNMPRSRLISIALNRLPISSSAPKTFFRWNGQPRGQFR